MNSVSLRLQRMGLAFGVVLFLALACWLLVQVRMVAGLVTVSILLAYIIAPGVDYLCRRKLPRVLSILIIYILLGLLLGFFISYLLPVVTHEFTRFGQNIGILLSNLDVIVENGLTWTAARLPESMSSQIALDQFKLSQLFEQYQFDLTKFVGGTLPGVFTGMKSVAGLVTATFLVPLLTFYILMDTQAYKRSFLSLVPKLHRPKAVELMHRINVALGLYIRGQIIVCITIGCFVSLALSLMGIDYAVLIGIFAGIVDIIPYVGVILGLIPAFLIALVNKGLLYAIITIAVLECVHWAEGHIVVPAVVGHSVGLPPLTVMVALLVGAELGGIMGMFVAVPIAAILRVIIEFFLECNSLFGPVTDEDLEPYDSSPPQAESS